MKLNALGTALSVLLITLVGQTAAKASSIYTQSVQYCSDAQIILVERFQVAYYPSNQTLDFDAVANLINNSVDPLINAELTAYGMTPVNLTIDLCDIASGVLCPIPTYQFEGSATYFLPDSATSQIPSIAYYVPNLEATVAVRIYDQQTNTEAACLFVRLSNGLSTNHNSITWAVSAVVILGFLYSVFHYLYPIEDKLTGPDYRLMTFVTWLQFIVTTGVVSVEYPPAFTAFTRNFAAYWGLIYIDPIQDSLADQVSSTGGSNRSPQSATDISGTLQNLLSDLQGAIGRIFGNDDRVRSDGAVSIPEVAQSSIIDAHEGIDQFVQQQGIETGTAFTMSLIVFLFLAACLVVITILVAGIMALRNRRSGKSVEGAVRPPLRTEITSFAVSMGMKVLRVALLPLITLGVFQFRFSAQTGYGLLVVTGIFWALLVLSVIALTVLLHAKLRKKSSGSRDLAQDPYFQQRYGPIFPAYKPGRQFYTGFQLVSLLLRGIFVGAFQDIPLGQIIPLIIIEVFTFLIICVFRPYQSKWSNVLDGFLSIARFVCLVLLITFLQTLNINRIVVTVIGFVILVIESVVILILFAILITSIVRTVFLHTCSSRSHEKYIRRKQAKQGAILPEKKKRKSSAPTVSRSNLVETNVDGVASNGTPTSRSSESPNSSLNHGAPQDPMMSQKQGSKLSFFRR